MATPYDQDPALIDAIRRKLLTWPDDQRVDWLRALGLCLACGADLIDPTKPPAAWDARCRCHCHNDE